MMRILVYKRTHNGDPDSNGCFGVHDCMGKVRARPFDAVIGVGGLGREAHDNEIAGKVNWIGIGATRRNSTKKKPKQRGPLVTFDRFHDLGIEGRDLRELAPNLAARIYDKRVRHVMDGLSDEEYEEALAILKLAEKSPSSLKATATRAGTLHGHSATVTCPKTRGGRRKRC
jgi:hypothetical protein